MNRKKLPVGIDDFKVIIENDFYFVDKSLLIEEILVNRAAVTLMPRPRRFGKTLNMSMLRYYFDIENKDENRKLFKNLKIEKTSHIEEQGKYPVIYMSFKDFRSNTWEGCYEQIENLICDLYQKNLKIIKSLDNFSQEQYKKICKKEGTKSDVANSIQRLSNYMCSYYGEKVIIIIDEYDTPLTSAFIGKYYDESITFFRNLLSSSLKGNLNLEFGIMTGITRVAKESIFSGLNNLDVATILDERYDYFGLKEEEVEELLKYYGLIYKVQEVKKWYNGYSFGNEKIYNPWSIINFANQKKLCAYWINTSDNQLIKNILKDNNSKILEDLETLFLGKTIEKKVTESIVYEELDKIDTIWSLFLFSGYVTNDSKRVSTVTGATTYNLIIPNLEVRTFFGDTFINENSGGDSVNYLNMLEELYYGNIEKFISKFKKVYKSVISYHDVGDNEKYYHNFMIGLLINLSEKYIISSNRESGDGRYDIIMYPREEGKHGIIFEFKFVKNKEKLKIKVEEALLQIKEKNYGREMKNYKVKKIINIGIAFSGKDLNVEWEEEVRGSNFK